MKLRKVLLIAAAGAIATACAAEQDHPDPPRDPAPIAAPEAHGSGSNAPEPQRPPQIVHERACGAFTAIDKLANDATAPKPDPSEPTPQPNGSTLIGLASALQTMDRQGLSKAMNAALTAHAYALTNLGALINHGASKDDIDSMATVADTTSSTVHALCDPE